MDTISHAMPGVRAPVADAWSARDLTAMQHGRALARRGAGRTWTNPMVGAVVVSGDEVVGSAFHPRAGEAHAETLALAAAGDRARGATLYVNLEPCLHHGRTPPCVEAIRSAGIARVVMSAPDPDARVCGHGAGWLREHGVRVDVGCDAAAAILDNHGYYHDRLGLGPTVTLKMATSRDGMVARAPGRRDRITGDDSQLDVHRLRAVHDAIVVGSSTARIDRPQLDCRLLPDGVDREPVTVVFDTTLAVAADADWPVSGREFIVMAGERADPARVRAVEARGGRVIRCEMDGGSIAVRDAIERLATAGLARILVEGGPRLFASFVGADAWDAFWHYQSTAEVGSPGVPMTTSATDVGLERQRVVIDEMAFGADVRQRYARAASWQRLLDSLLAKAGAPGRGTNGVHGNR